MNKGKTKIFFSQRDSRLERAWRPDINRDERKPSVQQKFSLGIFAIARKKCFGFEPNKGFIALTSSIIISALILIIAFTLSLSTFFGRFNVLNAGFKEISYGLAEACADTALLKLAQNSSYGGNETINVDADTCLILPIESLTGQKIVKTKADFRGAVTNIKITASSSPAGVLTIALWEELPNL